MKKGEKLVCGLCGLGVTVCDECGCETHELVCCGEPMKAAKAKPKKKTAKKASRK
jgi:hypothetical protein